MIKTLQKIKQYMGGLERLFPISLILSALNGVISFLPFLCIWLIIQELLKGGTITNIASYAAWGAAIATILSICIYTISLLLSHVVAFRVEVEMRRQAMRKVINMPLGQYDQTATGKIRKIIDENATNIHTFVAHLMPDLIGSIILPVIVILFIIFFNWKLGLACIIPIISAVWVMSIAMNPKNSPYLKLYMDAQDQMGSDAVEYVRGIPVVKIFQQTVFSFKKFNDSILNYRDLVIKCTLDWRQPMCVYTTLINSIALFLVPATIIILNNNNAYGILTDMVFYALITPLVSVQVMKIMHLQMELDIVNQLIERVETITEGGTPTAHPLREQEIKSHEIKIEQLTYHYPESKEPAVKEVSMTIPEGATYALVGESGGGKTTLARLIAGLRTPYEGNITIGGISLHEIPKDQLMRNISFVFQNSKLFKKSIRDNILYGKRDATEEEISRAIELSQSKEIIDGLPMGLDTMIGSEGTYLSGGEQQRIALARAFLKDAPIVILDEATAFADPENEHQLQAALKNLMKGKTALIIAHRLTTIKDVDKILVMEKGEICETGTHDELLAKKGLYHKMWIDYQQAIEWTI